MAFNLEDYEEVKDRIPKFFESHTDGRIITELISDEGGAVVFRAALYKDREDQELSCPLSTGWAQETAGSSPVNKTSHLENCETSAIGRALANIGICGKNRPSREEMAKVERPAARTNDNQLDAKRKAFFANAKKLGFDADAAKEYAKGMFDAESFNDLTVEQLRKAFAALREMGAQA